MATTEKARASRRKSGSVGLLAIGASGPWEIAIDEATSGPDRWWAQIEGSSVSLSFEIPSLDTIGKIALLFDSWVAAPKGPSNGLPKRHDSLVIGKDKKTPITLVKDDEYDDRFFLLVGSTNSPTVRIVIAGTDIMNLAEALRQVKEDLDGEDSP